jgi:glyoxylase-like metal-dependent hydrolase (beta-lactamase superfamily II)
VAAAGGGAPAPQPQPAAVEERTMEVWSTPQGFLKAAAANNATSQEAGGGSEVTFTAGKNKFVGTINAQNQVEKVQTWINNPVLGDMLVETTFSDYRDFNGTQFPAHIVRQQGGYPVLDLTVSSVTKNGTVDLTAPEQARNATVPPVMVTSEKLADGVYYLKGGSHHSLAIDQSDHIVVIEGPQEEARSVAVIAKAKELIPNKPIKYLINTHAHFDHSGGLRGFVAEGVTVITHEKNKAYLERILRNPFTLAPDRLARSTRRASIETVADKRVITDGTRSLELHHLKGNLHEYTLLMAYLPKERLLIQADAFHPRPGAAPLPAPSPFTTNLVDNVERLKLDVDRVVHIHGGVDPYSAVLKAAGRP